jgi:hypothetical protein
MQLETKQNDRFWNKVNKDASGGCWEWIGNMHNNGYGLICIDKTHWRAHRLSYCIKHGSIPEGMYLMHQCDNKVCVNPEHLKPGTHQENMADMKAKGRAAKGKRKRLTDDQIRYILESGKSLSTLTAELKVHPRTVERVRERYMLVEDTEETTQSLQ